jgi:hypothetical protein
VQRGERHYPCGVREDGLRDGLVIIVCPLEIERRAVARAIESAGVNENLALLCSGPGPGAVRAVLEKMQLGQTREQAGPKRLLPHVVILAGLAGGLVVGEPGEVARVGRVVDSSGRGWTSWEGDVLGATTVVAGVDQPVCTASQKRSLHERTGAHLVDTESHAFAQVCDAAGVPWCVVRGVSDGPDEALPEEAVGWVDSAGRTRAGRVVLDVLRRPRLVGDLRRLGAASSRVLPLVGQRVVELIGRTAGLERR